MAWEQRDQVEDTLPNRAAAAVLTDADALASAWEEHGFVGETPEVNFDDYVVVLLAQADDACPDEFCRFEVVDGQLEVEWVAAVGDSNDAPAIRIAKWAPTDVLAAQEALTALTSGERGPGTIVGMSGPPGPVHIDMVAPTRDALDAVADLVDLIDPNLVCVTPQLRGSPPATRASRRQRHSSSRA